MQRAWLLLAAVTVAPMALADEFTPQELAAAKADRQEQIKEIASEIRELENKRDKSRNRADKERLGDAIKSKTRTLNETKRKTPQDLARVHRQSLETEKQKLVELAQKREAEARDDAERMKKSGNCPLRIDFATFAHLSDVDSIAAFHEVDAATTLGFTPLTAVVLEVTNRIPQDVEAWEMTYDLLDGFGEIIHSGSHRNPLVRPGDKARIRISAKHVPEAVQMTIHIARAKMKDGTIWERRPEHEQVSETVKKLEGADLLKRASQ